jgi:CelD/BcsL family acetyltransferase involved in cellulose biosynthesis
MLMTREKRLHIVAGAAGEADAVAALAWAEHAFLRGAWADAAAPGQVRHMIALRSNGRPLAAFPLVDRRVGPFTIREVAGCYWPFRSVALAEDAREGELIALLGDPAMKGALGNACRVGPIFDSDPAACRLRAAAKAAGWSVLVRSLGTCFEIDVAALQTDGPWPRASSLKKNRWREKKLAELGQLETLRFTGADWTPTHRDAIAAIEANSWLAREEKAGFQFADPVQRRYWERVAEDPVIAPMIFGTILNVGGTPAAFTFGLDVGTTRYQIANNYDERFAALSAGRTLLVSEFDRAAREGVSRISWGSGDAGYKSEMGARPGPEILDLLFVRPKPLALALKRVWTRA